MLKQKQNNIFKYYKEEKKDMIIGLTGTKASGKGVVAEILKKKDFAYFSLSDRVREEAVSRGLTDYKVKDLQDIGNELREKYGGGVLVRKTLELVKKQGNERKEGKDMIIDGIRNIYEVEELKKQEYFGYFGYFILIAVDAPREVRFERLVERGRKSDPKTYEEFLEMDKRDLGNKEIESGQQVKKCIEAANYKIQNDNTLEDLEKKIDEILGSMGMMQM